MRSVAQPVAVITANLQDPTKLHEPDHGATVSSFVSIAMAPTPLVAFALRLPSRLATHLTQTHIPEAHPTEGHPPNFQIHLLSSTQEDLARSFARQPPSRQHLSSGHASASPSQASSFTQDSLNTFAPFPRELFEKLDEHALGTLDCSVVGKLQLLDPLPPLDEGQVASKGAANAKVGSESQATSQLYVARVSKVKLGQNGGSSLLYCHQSYHGIT